jgi:methyl-accepting chemotaxis protein
MVLLSSTTGKPIVVIANPVRSGDTIKGVLYAVIDLGGFTQAHLDTIKVGETGYIYDHH